jgi:hypothetical protein
MSSIEYSQSAYTFVVGPHIETAIWAIIAALACVLVVIVGEMVKKHKAEAGPTPGNRPKKPNRRR